MDHMKEKLGVQPTMTMMVVTITAMMQGKFIGV
jgi:hypothetical protein